MHHLDYYHYYVRVRHDEQLADAARRRLADRPDRLRQLRERAARSLVRLAQRLSDEPVLVERSAAERVVDVSDASGDDVLVDVDDRSSNEPVGAASQGE